MSTLDHGETQSPVLTTEHPSLAHPPAGLPEHVQRAMVTAYRKALVLEINRVVDEQRARQASIPHGHHAAQQ